MHRIPTLDFDGCREFCPSAQNKQDLENNGCSDQEVNMATQIICRASDCIFNEAKLCTSVEIIYDPAEGCLTYEAQEDRVDLAEGEEVWEEEELEWADEELLLEDETEGWEWEDENALEDEFEEDLDEDTTAM
jgi:hypothetical protein